LTPPVLALLVGAILATTLAWMPAGLRDILALAFRFALAVGVGYAVFFAISSGRSRTAGLILGILGGLIVIHVLAGVASINLELVTRLQIALLNWPGPLAIFTGRWMLIDV
jgi:hypothetical protein